MATQREILKRINSVSSTKKITKTMEMVSTAKMKKMQDRLTSSTQYAEKTDMIISHLMESGIMNIDEPLMKERSGSNKVLLISISGNRGLCGGYNTNVINNTINFKEKLETEEGKEVLLYAIGNKGINYFRFINQPIYKSIPNHEDKLVFNDASDMGLEMINQFLNKEIDEVYISYTAIITSSTQKPAIIKLLPISFSNDTDKNNIHSKNIEYIFEPGPDKVLSSLLPLYIKVKIYNSLLESSFSEQFARRVAMKNATDAATDIVKDLTIKYNRARQAKITNEIAEIVGGAAAL